VGARPEAMLGEARRFRRQERQAKTSVPIVVE
jgi:hypothetical protein